MISFMRRQAPKKEVYHAVDEVRYKNHLSEFQRFYLNHKSFCDEIAGNKSRTIFDGNEYKDFRITKDTFIYAIRRLYAHVIDNLHYIKNIKDERKLEHAVEELEQEFLKDSEYQRLAQKGENRTSNEEITLTKLYLEYVIRIYNIGNKLNNLLQNSLMIATSSVSKDVEFYTEVNFYDELSKYRTEISDAISNFRFRDTLTQVKKIVGYHYTYKILLDKEDQRFTHKLLELLIKEVLSDEVIRLLRKDIMDEFTTTSDKRKIETTHYNIRKVLLKVYRITNGNLSERKILPKILRKVHIDKTGI